MNSVNLSIVINSPYASYFATRPSSLGIVDTFPLHVQVKAESFGKRNRNSYQSSHLKMASGIKKFQIVVNQETESTTGSSISTASINIISNFTEKNTVSQYRKIIVGFYLIVTISFGANTSMYLAGGLPWDNTNILTNNPLNDTMNFMKLQHLTTNILLNFWDIQEYKANSELNTT